MDLHGIFVVGRFWLALGQSHPTAEQPCRGMDGARARRDTPPTKFHVAWEWVRVRVGGEELYWSENQGTSSPVGQSLSHPAILAILAIHTHGTLLGHLVLPGRRLR